MASKALAPIVVTELGMLRDVSFDIPTKANSPIVVTELGMLRDVRDDIPPKV